MQRHMYTVIFLISFCCVGFSGKIFTGDTDIYKEIEVEYRGNKLILKDWESGNRYEFEYYGKGAGKYRGYDWDKGHVLELQVQDNGKGIMLDCDSKFFFKVDLGNLKRLEGLKRLKKLRR